MLVAGRRPTSKEKYDVAVIKESYTDNNVQVYKTNFNRKLGPDKNTSYFQTFDTSKRHVQVSFIYIH
jgi:hypothetical protein